MPLGIVSESEFQKEKESHVLPSCKVEEVTEIGKVIDIERGRGNKEEVPESVRALVASESICGAPTELLVKEFKVSPSSISAYKVGATSTSSYHNPDSNLKKSNDEVRVRVTGLAQQRLIDALEKITPEKLDESGVKVLASVARDMSTVAKNMEHQDSVQINNTIVYRPRMREEDDYEVIQVNE